MSKRIGAVILCLVLFVSGCAKKTAPPASPDVPDNPPAPPVDPAAPVKGTPRLLLDLKLGDEPDQPGNLPGRVGGIEPRGPLAIVAHWGSVYLVDQAKGRVLHYADGKLTDRIAAPWLNEQVADAQYSPFGLILSGPGFEHTIGTDGRLLAAKQVAYNEEQERPFMKEFSLLGDDRLGNSYEQATGERGSIVRRVNKDRVVTDVVDMQGAGEIRDFHFGRDGALYALTWDWEKDGITRARVYEVLPTVTISSPPGGMEPFPPPVLLGQPVPSTLRLRFPDWAPVEVKGEIDRWNIWQLLSTAAPATAAFSAQPYEQFTMEATFADGTKMTLNMQDDALSIAGKRYTVGAPEGLYSLVQSLRLSETGMTAALSSADSVQIAIADLPGVELELSPDQRRQLRERLAGGMIVNDRSGPQPLEPAFPRYTIRVKGADWESSLVLAGDRHMLMQGRRRVAVLSAPLATLVRSWLPVPDVARDEPGYLYLSDKLEIGQGIDLTRWKNSVVRRLTGAEHNPNSPPTFTAPLTLTFYVKGEKLKVEVDTEGFTYAGKRYAMSGLTDMASMQSVP